MKSRKPRPNLKLQRARRAQPMLDLMEEKDFTAECVAAKTGTIYGTIEAHTPGQEVIAFVGKQLGKTFTEIDLWFNYPNRSAA